MAFKPQAPEARPVEARVNPPTQTLRLAIKGLHELDPGNFELTDVPMFDVRWDRIQEILEESGLPKHDAMMFVEESAERLFQTSIAKVLGRRTTLIERM